MLNKKMKAVTLSFDDGVTQDKKLIKLLDKYGLKCTFNINSGLLGRKGSLIRSNVEVNHTKIDIADVREVYQNHEIAVHTFTHPNLTTLDEDRIIEQVNTDRTILTALVGYGVYGMAYPCGGVNNDDRVAQIIKDSTKIKFCRTITSTHNYDLQSNLYKFNPTIHWQENGAYQIAERFIKSDFNSPQLLYIWGHSYEMDIADGWEEVERLFRLVSGKDDIYYGTNAEVLLKPWR